MVGHKAELFESQVPSSYNDIIIAQRHAALARNARPRGDE